MLDCDILLYKLTNRHACLLAQLTVLVRAGVNQHCTLRKYTAICQLFMTDYYHLALFELLLMLLVALDATFNEGGCNNFCH